MSKIISISIATKVFEDIELLRKNIGRSEFVENLIRDGIVEIKKKEGDVDVKRNRAN